MNPEELLDAFKLDRSLDEYAKQAGASLANGHARFARFRVVYDQEFPVGSLSRISADVLVWALLGEILILYYLGLIASLVLELHATLEYYARRDLPALTSPGKEGRDIVQQLVERRTLSELSNMLVTLAVWDKDDAAFVARLAKLRNGIAHNNSTALSRALGGQTFGHINDARIAVAKVDILPYVICTIVALQKLSAVQRDKTRQHLEKARSAEESN